MSLPQVIADGPLPTHVLQYLEHEVELLSWNDALLGGGESAVGLYTFGHPKVDDELLDKLPKLRVISNYGVGVDHIDVEAAKRRQIPVGNTPGVLNGATADIAFGLILAAARRLGEGERRVRSGHWSDYPNHLMLGKEVHGSTIGIIGLGRIGQEVAKRAQGFSMPVLYHNRSRNVEAELKYNALFMPLPDLLQRADYIVITVPLTPQTRGMIGREQLALMKPSAILVNVARGPVVDTIALTEAIATKKIFAAGLDVTDPEPLPKDHPLLQHENVVVIPHLGSATEQTRNKMAQLSAANLLAGIQGKPLIHEV